MDSSITTSSSSPAPASVRKAPSGRRRLILIFVALFLVVLTGLARWIGIWGGNVREVKAGRAYRSAQLRPAHLRDVVNQYGIKSVLNLQGDDHGDKAQAEQALCREVGAEYLHAKMSAVRLPGPRELDRVVAALDAAERPVLIHCRAGADRSGLVSALYLVLHEGVPVDQAARSELTWTKGHFGFQTAAMDQFFDLYRETGAGQDLRTWIRRTYPDVFFRVTGKQRAPKPQAPPLQPATAR